MLNPKSSHSSNEKHQAKRTAMSSVHDLHGTKLQQRRASGKSDYLGALWRARSQGKGPAQLKALMAKGGFDTSAMEKIALEHRANLCALANTRMKEAVTQSDVPNATLASQVAQWRKISEYYVNVAPPQKYFALDTPTNILASPGWDLQQQQLQPYRSWAKAKFQTTENLGSAKVTFEYIFRNTTGLDLVANADAFLVVNGWAEADDTTDFWVFDHAPTKMTVFGQMDIINITDPNAPFTVGGAYGMPSYTLDAYGDGWPFSVGAIVAQNIFRGYDLQVGQLVMFNGSTYKFAVSVVVNPDISDGEVKFDLASGNWQVSSPLLTLNVTS